VAGDIHTVTGLVSPETVIYFTVWLTFCLRTILEFDQSNEISVVRNIRTAVTSNSKKRVKLLSKALNVARYLNRNYTQQSGITFEHLWHYVLYNKHYSDGGDHKRIL